MEIVPFSKNFTEDMLAVQHVYEREYPLAEKFESIDLKNPLLEGRRNISLAVKNGRVIGFLKFLVRQNFSRQHFHRLWLDIRILPGYGRIDTMRALFEASLERMRRSLSNLYSAGGVRLCVKLHESETDSETFFDSVGFSRRFDFIYMRQNLEEFVLDWPSFPEGIQFKAWKPKGEIEIMKYLTAEQACFPDSPLEYKYLNYFFSRPEWKTDGKLLTAFDSRGEIVASVMVYPHGDTKNYYTEEVFVIKKWRNRGLAGAMIAGTLSYLQKRGAKGSLLSVTSDRTTAFRIYERAGYEQVLSRKVLMREFD